MGWECHVIRGLNLWYKRIYHTLHQKRQFTNCFNKISRQNLYYWLYKWVCCSIYRITKVFRGHLELLAIHDYLLWKKFYAMMASRIYWICKFARTHFLRSSSSVVTLQSSCSPASYKMQTVKALGVHSYRASIPAGREKASLISCLTMRWEQLSGCQWQQGLAEEAQVLPTAAFLLLRSGNLYLDETRVSSWLCRRILGCVIRKQV